MNETDARDVIEVWARAVRRKTLRISNWFSYAVVVSFFGGIGIAFIPEMLTAGMGLMGAGGTLLLPALYLTRRANHLGGPKSLLAGLIDKSIRVTSTTYTRRAHQGVEEMVVTIRSGTGRTSTYPVSTASCGADHVESYGGGLVEELKLAFSVLVEVNTNEGQP